MLKQLRRNGALKHPFLRILGISGVLLIISGLVACGGSGPGSTTNPTPTTQPVSTPTPTPVPGQFKVTSVDLAVNPDSIAGRVCGSSASFTYTATFHVPENTAGGTVQFLYTWNNGRASPGGNVTVGAGETTKTFTFSTSGTLYADHTYPGIAQVLVNSPDAISSPQVKPAGFCTPAAGTFKVTSIDMAVSPTTLTGTTCGSPMTVIYTATFHIAANSPGGTIQFLYTWNNGRASPGASVTVGPDQRVATYSFKWSGNLSADHVLPGLGGVSVSSPNVVSSPMVKPAGMCSGGVQ